MLMLFHVLWAPALSVAIWVCSFKKHQQFPLAQLCLPPGLTVVILLD
jgi:hypothetical protein